METQYSNSNKVNSTKLNVGFFFLSLGFLIALITSVVSFLNLAFDTLDKKFPDVLNSSYTHGYMSYDYDQIRTSLATLIIFFPVFLIVAFFWKRFIKKGLSLLDNHIHRWIIYVVLFLSALVVAIDLVTLVRYFVSGEITDRFVYKVLITLLVALFVGVYFIFELLNKEKFWGFQVGITSAIKSSVLVVLLVWFSFSVMGSPKTQRLLRLDDRRVQDLQTIQYQVINFWQQKEKLPEKMTDLVNPLSGFALPVDPEFEKGYVYEYAVTDKMTFELCATFAKPIPKGWREDRGVAMPMYDIALSVKESPVSYPGMGGINESWAHDTGHACFARTIDPEMYPPFSKN